MSYNDKVKRFSYSARYLSLFITPMQVIECKWTRGHISRLSNDCDDTDDSLQKMSSFIGPVYLLLCNSRNVNCKVRLNLMKHASQVLMDPNYGICFTVV
jgi:hypothetical protein